MNFLSWPCTVTLSACGPAPQCTANCRCLRLVAGGVQTSARPADPPSCQRALDVGGFHQFQSVFFPYTALEQSTRRWREQLLTSGLTHHFFFSFSFSCLTGAADIFTAAAGCVNISSPPVAFEPRRAAAPIFLSSRRPRRRLKAISARRRLICSENQSDNFTFQTLRPTRRYAVMEKLRRRFDGRLALPFISSLRV